MKVVVAHHAVVAAVLAALTAPAATEAQAPEYEITVLEPGGPLPRLPDGHPDLSGHWFPNGAGQGVSGRFGVDPAAMRTFDPRVTPEEPPAFQPWAREKIASMTPTALRIAR